MKAYIDSLYMQMEEEAIFESSAQEYYSSDEIDSETESFLYSQVHHKAPSESSELENAAKKDILNRENAIVEGEGAIKDAHPALPKNTKNSRTQAPGRYYVSTDCHLCGFPGHVARRCYMSAPVCHLCGLRGHRRVFCPEELCFNCHESGHKVKACRQQRRKLNTRCTRCRCVGHQYEHCSEVWRQYHATTKNEKIVRVPSSRKRPSRTFYCFNCGKKGHLGHDCRCPLTSMFLRPVPPFVVVYDKMSASRCGANTGHSSNVNYKDRAESEKSTDITVLSSSKEKLDASRPYINSDHRCSSKEYHTTFYSRDGDRRKRPQSGENTIASRDSESTIARGQAVVDQNSNENGSCIRVEESINTKVVKAGQQVIRVTKKKKGTVTNGTARIVGTSVKDRENSTQQGKWWSFKTGDNYHRQPGEQEAASVTPSTSCNGCAAKDERSDSRKRKKKQRKESRTGRPWIDVDTERENTVFDKTPEQAVNKRLREDAEEDLRCLITKRKKRKIVSIGIEETGANCSRPDVIELSSPPCEGAAGLEMTLPRQTKHPKGRTSQGSSRKKVASSLGDASIPEGTQKRIGGKKAANDLDHEDVIYIGSSGSETSIVIQLSEKASGRERRSMNSNEENYALPAVGCGDRVHPESEDLAAKESAWQGSESGRKCYTREHDLTRYDPTYAFLAPPYSSLVPNSLRNTPRRNANSLRNTQRRKAKSLRNTPRRNANSLRNTPRQNANAKPRNNFVRKTQQRKRQASGRRK